MFKLKQKETEESVGFLPEEYLVKRRERRTNVMAIALFITVMSSVAIAFVVTDRNWQDVRTARVVVNEQFALATDQEVSRFMDAMVDLKLISRVRLEYSREKEIGDQLMREYRMVMTIGPSADVRQMAQIAEEEVAQ